MVNMNAMNAHEFTRRTSNGAKPMLSAVVYQGILLLIDSTDRELRGVIEQQNDSRKKITNCFKRPSQTDINVTC